LWHLNGTIESLTGRYYSSYGDATWVMWPAGRFVAIAAPRDSPAARLFASDSFGRNASLLSNNAESSDIGLAANPWTGEFATFGGSPRITFWRANGTPYAELSTPDPCPVPPPGRWHECIGAFAWIGPDAAVAWNTVNSQLYRLDVVRTEPPFWVTIDEPANGSVRTGDFLVGGRCDVIDGGVVWVRADGLAWQRLPCKGVWYATLNATYWRPGNHTIFAALYDGSVFSQWATIQILRPKDANSTAEQPTVFWRNPIDQFGPSYNPLSNLTVGGFSPNTADAILLKVWFRLDGSPWQAMVLDGRWTYPLDAGTLSKGYHTFEALGWDGTAFSEIDVVRAFYNVEPAQIQLWATIDSPAPQSVIPVASVFQGQWGARNLANGSAPGISGIWVEISVGGGPWFRLNDTHVSAGHWNFTLPSPFAVTSTLTFCVRAANITRLGEPFCSEYYAPRVAVDLAPSIAITAGSGSRSSSGTHDINVNGTALDDYGIVAVFVRVDGGSWNVAQGTGDWSISLLAAPYSSGNHTVEAIAYDGFRYSPVVGRDIHVDISAPPTDGNPADQNPNGGGTGTFNFLTEFSLVWILVTAAIASSVAYWVALRRRRPDPPE
jgi:Big-like domain-containing protein